MARGRPQGAGAVLFIRDPGIVAFCATRGLKVQWWPRGSDVEPNGVLFPALEVRRIAGPGTYRWGFSYSHCCSATRYPSMTPSRCCYGSAAERRPPVEILEDPEPAWQQRSHYSAWFHEQR